MSTVEDTVKKTTSANYELQPLDQHQELLGCWSHSPGVTQELGLFSFFPPDEPLPEGGVDKHPGPVPPLHQEDGQVVHPLLEVLPV